MMRPAVFLDRDGVINRSPPPGEYVRNWSEFEFFPSIFDWVRLFHSLDLPIIVVTNQRGIALGRTMQAAVDDIHRRMTGEFARRGCPITDVFVCPHMENSCDCRKPKPGMVLVAQRKWDLDLSRSLMISDSDRDRDLALVCGMRFLRAADGTLSDEPLPDRIGEA